MPQGLPTFKGYTVDTKLSQFRKVSAGPKIEFVDFGSVLGDELLDEYVEALNEKKAKDAKILQGIMNSL